MQPLADLKVLDLTWHVAGPYCTKLLADYGADVIKVERPLLGDPARSYGPFPGNMPQPERSGMFLHLNTNKRSITVNFTTEGGKVLIQKLAGWADVVVENFAPGTLVSQGFNYEALSAVNPGIVMCSISNFGQTGPYRDCKATEFILAAMAGFTYIQGVQGREPLKSTDHLQEYQAGAHGAMAVLGAVLHRRHTGVGQHIDVSIYEVACDSADRRSTQLTGYAYTGVIAQREIHITGALPVGIFPCKDGLVNLMVSPPTRWPRFLEMVDRQDLIHDPRLQVQAFWSTPEAQQLVDTLLYPWLIERTKQEVFEAAAAARIGAGPVNTFTEVLQEKHLRNRGYFVEADHPQAGRLPYTGPSFRCEGEGWELRSTAPTLGQHNREVLCGMLGLAPEEFARSQETGAI